MKKRLTAALFALALILALTCPALALRDDYTYTIRVYAGAQGTINGKSSVVFTGLRYGERFTFDINTVEVKNGSKYYVKGIREAGKDNSDMAQLSFAVTQDQDYVVTYGIRGEEVAYYVDYTDEYGNIIASTVTYYGNVGDKPIVAYYYIEGYQPRYYNLTKTLSSNEEENNFSFIYISFQIILE